MAAQALTPEGWQNHIQIGIDDDGTIGYVGPEKMPSHHKVALLLPAPVNLHSHSFQRAMSGLTERRGPDPRDSFWTWRKLMYRFLDHLTPDHIETITALVFMEMLEAGFAGVAEFHYLHHGQKGHQYENPGELSQRIIEAARHTGIGLTLLPVLYQYGGCDLRPLEGSQRRFYNSLDQFADLFETAKALITSSHNDYSIGIAPHSLRAVDPQSLTAAIKLNPGGPIHIHLAEQVAEVDEVCAHLHARPAQWLLDNHQVDQRWCLIHCTQINATETMQLAQSGAITGLCPITESSLGDGIFNGTDYNAAGGRWGIGSDSNIHISLFEELKILEYSQRLRDHSRAALATNQHSVGRVMFDNAVRGGAKAAHRNAGAIMPGLNADLIGLETDNQFLCHRHGDVILDSLIFGGHGQSCITDVWSAGRHVVENGKHHHKETIIQNFKNTIAELENSI